MTRAEILDDLTITFREVFDDDALVVTEALSAEQVEQWDSLRHINLILAVEAQFGIKFKAAEVERLTTVGDLVETIGGKVR